MKKIKIRSFQMIKNMWRAALLLAPIFGTVIVAMESPADKDCLSYLLKEATEMLQAGATPEHVVEKFGIQFMPKIVNEKGIEKKEQSPFAKKAIGPTLATAALMRGYLSKDPSKVPDVAMIYLQSSDGTQISLPLQFLSNAFKEKIYMLNVAKESNEKKLVIDCGMFSSATLACMREIIIGSATEKLLKKIHAFPKEKINTLIKGTPSKEPEVAKQQTIARARELLRAIKFFGCDESFFQQSLQECIVQTACSTEELLVLEYMFIDQLGGENLRSLDQEENEFQNNLYQNELNEDVNLVQKEMYEHLHLSPKNKRFSALDLLKKRAQKDPYIAVANPSIIDKESWQALEIICGSPKMPNSYFLKSIDRTCSELGKALLYTKLLQPTDRTEKIEKNQKILKTFIDNSELAENLNKSLAQFFGQAEKENGLLSCLPVASSYINSVINSLYVPNKYLDLPKKDVQWLNSNEVATSLWNAKDKISLTITDFITKPVDAMHQNMPWISTGLQNSLRIMMRIPEFYRFDPSHVALLAVELVASKLMGIGILPLFITSLVIGEAHKIVQNFVECVKYKNYRKDKIQAELDVTKCMYEKICNVAEFIKMVQAIDTQLKKNPELYELVPSLKKLEVDISQLWNFLWFDPRTWHDPNRFDAFISKLSNDVFTKKDDSWLKTGFGRIVATYYLISLHKERLLDMYMAIAELDQYLSMTRLYNEHKNSPQKFCFATLIESKNPTINVKNLWNPTLGAKAVQNTLELGGSQPKDAIITGPNTGGKSTQLRSIIYALLMAQTMGLCPADQAEITPFSHIKAYLNITDDAANDRSLFKASTERANELLKIADKPGSVGPSLLIFDELYNGTKPDAGEALAYGTLKNLNEVEKFPHSMCIACTHYPFIQDIRVELNDSFAYLRMCDGTEGKENKHKIVPGIYTEFNSFTIAQDAHLKTDVINYAQSRYEQVKNASFNSTNLYLEALRNKAVFDDFIKNLYEKKQPAIDFLQKVGTTTPYAYRLLQIAHNHTADIKALINYQDEDKRTLLHYLALKDIKDAKLVDFLMKEGADIHIQDSKGKKPIDYVLAQSIKDQFKTQNK